MSIAKDVTTNTFNYYPDNNSTFKDSHIIRFKKRYQATDGNVSWMNKIQPVPPVAFVFKATTIIPSSI
jgi:hypothetical protein